MQENNITFSSMKQLFVWKSFDVPYLSPCRSSRALGSSERDCCCSLKIEMKSFSLQRKNKAHNKLSTVHNPFNKETTVNRSLISVSYPSAGYLKKTMITVPITKRIEVRLINLPECR